MRPKSIVQFQWLYLAFLVLSGVATVLAWGQVMEQALIANPQAAEMMDMLEPFMAGWTAITYAISLLLWWLTAFKRSNVARWILVIFFIISALMVLYSLATTGIPTEPLTIAGLVGFVINAVAIYLLFRPDASAWFAGTPTPEEAAEPLA